MNNARQLAVVMFSDVVGYTAMMGDNETAALTLLQRNHQIQKSLIEKYNGTFVKEIGDGLLAYFPSADQAALCSSEIQKQVAEDSGHKVRIGLNLAEIILEKDDIFGDGVNIASRIEALADPGGIFFSEQVASALSESVRMNSVPMGRAKLKNVKIPVMIFALQGAHLPIPSRRRFQELANPKRKLAAAPALFIFLVVLGGAVIITVNYFNTRAKQNEARRSLNEIEQLVESSWRDYSLAYDRAKELQKIIPDEPRLNALIKTSSVKVNVTTTPEGAEVFVKRYNAPRESWQSIGRTPIGSVQLPIAVLRWKVEKEGYETVHAVDTDFDLKDITNMTKSGMLVGKNFYRVLDTLGSVPAGMTRVMGSQMNYGKLDDFFIDKFEVTNKQYKVFVDSGAYQEPRFWEEEFVNDNKSLLWKTAMELFKDKTGNPGPSSWSNGTYPIGQDNHPVSGVSWYEAAAYARFVRKDLPTGDHWGLGRGENTFIIKWPQMGGFALLAPFSNFNHTASVGVGSLDGITTYGAYDMAGNVREWCRNDTKMGKLIRGGGWNSNTYEFNHLSQAPTFDRSETNGFRCALYLLGQPLPEAVYRLTDVRLTEPLKQKIPKPVSDDIFNVYKSFYDYDQTELQSQLIERDESHPEWIQEKVVFRAAYNDEKVIAYLFLPRNASPPYQTVIYGPGTAAFFQASSNNIDQYYEYPVFLEYIVRSGRAVLFPVCQGTFERRSDTKAILHRGGDSYQYTEFISQVVKDFRRSIDYLQTRKDIDAGNISFYGMSWGPFVGIILTSIDKRIKTNVFISGGISDFGRPESNLTNFVTRVVTPTLMVNGKYDSRFPLDFYIKPLYDALAVRPEHKRLVLFESDHIPPREGMITETLRWFDKYMGKVKTTEKSL